jgi:hypothetical protein
VPELFVVMMIVMAGLIPWMIAIWALVTLQRIKQGQESLERKIDALLGRKS